MGAICAFWALDFGHVEKLDPNCVHPFLINPGTMRRLLGQIASEGSGDQ